MSISVSLCYTLIDYFLGTPVQLLTDAKIQSANHKAAT